jgi:transcriptional regulator with XRE-family HTH domain
MARYHLTRIRAWRLHRQLTLRQLADRINAGRDTPLISYASLGRIEGGKQPYSQDTLEAIAAALQVEPALLLCGQPNESEHLANLWPQLSPRQRHLVIDIIKAILANGSG